jgi:hypothetical protein
MKNENDCTMQEMSVEELEALAGGDDIGNAIGGALHYAWNYICAHAQMMTDTYGPEIWNTSMYS